MSAVKKAQSLGLTGTPTEIVAALNSLGAEDITRLALGKFLREREFLIYDGTTWYGSIQTLLEMSPSPIPSEHVPNIIALKSIITGTGGDGLATTQPVWAAKILSFVQLLATVAGDAGLVSVFYEMAGGRPYASLTVEQYNAQKAEAEAEASKDALRLQLQTLEQSFHAKKNVALENIRLGSITDYAGLVSAVQVGG